MLFRSIEIDSVSATNPLVGRLVSLRNRFFSHRDGTLVKLANLGALTGLSALEIDELIERARPHAFGEGRRGGTAGSRCVWEQRVHGGQPCAEVGVSRRAPRWRRAS